MRCKFCDYTISGNTHECPATGKVYTKESTGSDFLLSAVIAGATDSSILGAVIGGDVLGAVVGDLFGDGDLFD